MARRVFWRDVRRLVPLCRVRWRDRLESGDHSSYRSPFKTESGRIGHDPPLTGRTSRMVCGNRRSRSATRDGTAQLLRVGRGAFAKCVGAQAAPRSRLRRHRSCRSVCIAGASAGVAGHGDRCKIRRRSLRDRGLSIRRCGGEGSWHPPGIHRGAYGDRIVFPAVDFDQAALQ